MKIYIVVRDIIFLVLWIAILCVGIFTAKMTDVIDSNIIYVNRKIPPIDKWEKPENEYSEQSIIGEETEITEIDDIEWYNEDNTDTSENNRANPESNINYETEE